GAVVVRVDVVVLAVDAEAREAGAGDAGADRGADRGAVGLVGGDVVCMGDVDVVGGGVDRDRVAGGGVDDAVAVVGAGGALVQGGVEVVVRAGGDRVDVGDQLVGVVAELLDVEDA